MTRLIAIAAVLFLALAQTAKAQPVDTGSGVWFLCEYAHSKIPPSDNCAILDDDGFMVRDGVVFHVKVTDSRETKCRGDRIGNCFKRTDEEITAKTDKIGPVEVASPHLAVDYFGCIQSYDFASKGAFMEIRPAGEQCFWTPDKHYYLARYEGRIKLIEGD
ncbi:MAG: hypothetical protein VW169_12450 [Rhodospirillaceae bacterium]